MEEYKKYKSVYTGEEIDAGIAAVPYKAEKTYVDEQLALKANLTYVDEQLALKADLNYVNVELNNRYTKTEADNLLALKSDLTYVDTELAKKADKATTLSGYGITDAYTKSEVDEKVSSVYKFKGSCTWAELIAKTDQEVGYVWNVTDGHTKGEEYIPPGTNHACKIAYTASEDAWDPIGGDLSNYYNKSETDNLLSVKATYAYVNTELAKKLDLQTAEDDYATYEYVDPILLEKASKTELNTGLALKTDNTTFTSTVERIDGDIALKADKIYTDEQLALKADLDDMTAKLALKANQADMTAALDLKADSADVIAALALKEDTEIVNAKLALKADKTYVDSELAKKADKTYTDEQLALKTDKTYTDEQLSLKANQATTYTKIETDTLLDAKANASDVAASLYLKADKDDVDLKLSVKADITYVDSKVASVYKYQGTCTYAELIAKTDQEVGYVWNVTDAVGSVPSGTNWACKLARTAGADAWDPLAGEVDLSGYYKKTETYSQAEVNDKLTLKANSSDLATVATSGKYTDLLEQPSIYIQTEIDTKLAAKQNNLTEAQLSAVDSGISAVKVEQYDGYQTSKQDTLSEAQLAATNSGITETKVSTYDGYQSSKQDSLPTTTTAGKVLKSTATSGTIEWGDIPTAEIATTSRLGVVKVDGTTVTITADGVLSSVGGGGGGLSISPYSFESTDWTGSESSGYTLAVSTAGIPLTIYKYNSSTDDYTTVADTSFTIKNNSITLKSNFTYKGQLYLCVTSS